MQRNGETQSIAKMHMRFVFPALTIAVDPRDGTWRASASTTSPRPSGSMRRIVVWLATMLISWFLIRPSIGDTSESARKKMSAGIGVDATCC